VPEPKPEAEPQPKPKGAISRAWESVTGQRSSEPAAKAAPTRENLKSQLDARATAINARKDITPEQKEAALKKLRAMAKQGGVGAKY